MERKPIDLEELKASFNVAALSSVQSQAAFVRCMQDEIDAVLAKGITARGVATALAQVMRQREIACNEETLYCHVRRMLKRRKQQAQAVVGYPTVTDRNQTTPPANMNEVAAANPPAEGTLGAITGTTTDSNGRVAINPLMQKSSNGKRKVLYGGQAFVQPQIKNPSST